MVRALRDVHAKLTMRAQAARGCDRGARARGRGPSLMPADASASSRRRRRALKASVGRRGASARAEDTPQQAPGRRYAVRALRQTRRPSPLPSSRTIRTPRSEDGMYKSRLIGSRDPCHNRGGVGREGRERMPGVGGAARRRSKQGGGACRAPLPSPAAPGRARDEERSVSAPSSILRGHPPALRSVDANGEGKPKPVRLSPRESKAADLVAPPGRPHRRRRGNGVPGRASVR